MQEPRHVTCTLGELRAIPHNLQQDAKAMVMMHGYILLLTLLCIRALVAFHATNVQHNARERHVHALAMLEKDPALMDLQSKLFLMSSRTNRGKLASQEEHGIIADIVNEMEASNPAFEDDSLSSKGSWELIYSNKEHFLSSPLYMTIRALLDSPRASTLFNFQKEFFNTAELSKQLMTITDDEIICKSDIRWGILPVLPVTTSGTVIAVAGISSSDIFSMTCKLKDLYIEKSDIPLAKRVLESSAVRLTNLLKLPGGSRVNFPECTVTTYYLDADLKIDRDTDDNVYVYSRI